MGIEPIALIIFRARALLSSAGTRYISKLRVSASSTRNKIVLEELKKAGVVLNTRNVDHELAAWVESARMELEELRRSSETETNLWKVLEKVQERHPSSFAARLSGTTLFELFHRLIEARNNWNEDRKYPFETFMHSPVAVQADAFLAAVGGFWWMQAELNIYEIAQEGDEDEDKKEKIAVVEDMEMKEVGEEIERIKRDQEANQAMEDPIQEDFEKMELC
ncbi:hypothetical protein DL766_005472 [Monosporascus sp. MC13-8B]|uniref:Uncharacterized protein n=1 Tax=Monosporascus cannonballus TaxID=155416 RepID=A0ABY0HKY5_9PEZI|nr:hypothetical protein DL762_001351 [Monosporascus cannonballus]RYP00398.1 hypothetical protein DL763_000864 [Monosporascus cannonballus]RYP29261.1 hypothetical protein DL766_005472 [Monosporascus sp. MC13-8B]